MRRVALAGKALMAQGVTLEFKGDRSWQVLSPNGSLLVSQLNLLSNSYSAIGDIAREQKRHIKLLHIKLFPVAPVTGPPGRVSGQKDLCSLGSEDST